MTRGALSEIVRTRDACSGGRAAGCTTCGLRHECRLDDAGRTSDTALRYMSALDAVTTAAIDARRAGPGSTAESAFNSAITTARRMLIEAAYHDADDAEA